MVRRMERRMTLNLVPPTRGRRICEPVFLLSWVLITAKVIRASLVQVKEAWENGGGGEEGEEEGEDRAKDIHAGPSQTRCYDERPIRYVQHSKDPL